MKLVEGAVRRPVTVLMVSIAVVMFGLVAGSRLAVELLPDLSFPSLTVRTDFPDAAPSDVEQFVTRPVEEAVGVVPGLRRMHSVSRPGQSEVTLEFASGTRMDLASLGVREKLDLVTLPREVRRPALLRFDPALDPIVRFRLSGGDNLQRLRRLAERTVKSDLEGAPGVAAVRVAGGEEEEIRVDLDAGRLASAGLSVADVTRRLADENVNLAGGSLVEGQSEYLVRVANQFQSPAEMGQVILASRPDGLVRLSDVAQVARGAKEREVVARLDGKEAVEIAVYKEGDANTVAVARTVHQRVERLQLPAGMTLQTISDQSRFIEQAIRNVLDAAAIGGALAVLVIFAFLRDMRSTLVIGLSIPLSVFATFVAMYRFGLSFNLMSLGGLALGVGMLVDDSIVVLESIHRTRQRGMNIREAAVAGTRAVGMAVTASTLTTVVVFLPLVFVQGVSGQLIRDQALTVSCSLMASLGVALLLVPTIAALGSARAAQDAEVPAGGRAGRLGRRLLFVLLAVPRLLVRVLGWAGARMLPVVELATVPIVRGYEALERRYPGWVQAALARPRQVLAGATLALVAALAIAWVLPRNLFPSVAQGEFYFNVRMPEGTAVHVTDLALERLAEAVRGDGRVRFVSTSAGQTDLAAFSGDAREPHRGQIAVVLRTPDPRVEDEISSRLREAMESVPGLTYEFGRPALLTFENPVEVEVYAHDLDTLRAVTHRIAARIASVPGVEDVESSIRAGDPEVQVAFDRDRLATVQLDPAQASKLLRNAVQGEAATQFDDLDRKLDVRVRASEEERSHVDRLGELEVGRNAGRPVRLASVAAITLERGAGEIRRIAQQRAGVVSANLPRRDLASATRDIAGALDGSTLPPGVRVAIGGQQRELDDSFASIRFAMLLAVFLVYVVMASQFESLLHPFVIMFTLPLAVIGVVATLVATRTPVSVMVLIGLLVLSGIVVKNAIILVDHTNVLRGQGVPKIDALARAGAVRLRPILMTTLTTVLGLLPMALGIGEGAEVGAPLALTIMGGLTLATVLTLIVIPVVYATLDRRP